MTVSLNCHASLIPNTMSVVGWRAQIKGIFRDTLIQSTLFSTHTDFIVYSESTLLY